ncbi:MAG: ABC transporter substrate-binding protein [Phycisphaerales bacterium]|nr:ABC transporter substrate-binding protein [Phycisphaerales bacterium]
MTGRLATMAVALLMVVSCSKTPSPRTAHGVASMSPAVTALVQALGCGDLLVARSTFCRGVDDLPVVGDLRGANVEAIVRVAPSLVLYQATASRPPYGTNEGAQQSGASVLGVYMDNVDDLHGSIDRLAGALKPLCGDRDLAPRVAQLHAQLDMAMRPAEPCGVSVLLIQPGPELLAWGPDTWLGNLITAAGGQVVPPVGAWQMLTVEELVRLTPDVIVVLGETQPDCGTVGELPTPARDAGRIHPLVHPQLFIPGVHAADVRAQIDALLNAAS